ncbi:hypothetical protein [Leptolyngbya sp. BC1307]|uniref:hypothetical protein n=1 Tax=Leptolyngbya sp. BC1307 TaxID=2029589 RepID=UPI000EFD2216|nr:hypothetical protein [Leptolyngbya sp. BC1307]
MSLKVIELKFLLKLLGSEGYRDQITELSPNSKTKAAERDRVCETLSSKGYVDYDSEVAYFKIAPPGRTLLTLDTTSLPVTPDELKVLKACKDTMTPGKLPVPANVRQQLISSLAERGMLTITKYTIKEVRLSAQGKQFLRDEYDPTGNYPAATATMLGHYVKFLRESLGGQAASHLPSSQPRPQQTLSRQGQPGSQSSSSMPIGS